MKDLARPEWVFFDAGETLVSPRPSFGRAIVQICREAGCALDEFRADEVADACFREFLDLLEEFGEDRLFSTSPEKSRRFWTRYYMEFLQRMGVDGSEAVSLSEVVYDELSRFERYGLFDDVESALTALHASGINMGLVSNWEPWLDELIDYLGVGRFLEVRVISGREGIEKPNPEMFRRALLRAGAEPRAAVHVGDDPRADAQAASSVGMSVVLIDRRGRHPDGPWPKVSDLNCLVDLLGVRPDVDPYGPPNPGSAKDRGLACDRSRIGDRVGPLGEGSSRDESTTDEDE